MATIQTSLQLFDGMSPALKSINNTLSNVISSFDSLHTASDHPFDTGGIRAAQDELVKVHDKLFTIEDEIRKADAAQRGFNEDIRNGMNAADGLTDKIKRYVGMFAGAAAFKKAASWLNESLGFADIQTKAERQLRVVLANVIAMENAVASLNDTASQAQNYNLYVDGAASIGEAERALASFDNRASQMQVYSLYGDGTASVNAVEKAFDTIKSRASQIQGYTLYGDEAMLGGAAELATYIKDADAISSMMGTLANYAAGMSGGGAVDTRQMVEYATQLGKALDGTYDGLRQKGFELSDAQKRIIDNGTDMQRALVLEDVISQSWANLAEQMANTPQGEIIRFNNTLGDIRENIGNRLYQAVVMLYRTFSDNFPQIEILANGLCVAFQWIIVVLSGIVDMAAAVVQFFADNWSMIAPIILGVATALGVYNGVQVAANAVDLISKGIHVAMAAAKMIHAAATGTLTAATASQIAAQYGLNVAMYACPIVWIIGLIIAFIAIIYAAVGAVNHFAGTSVSATGIICGAFMVALAFVGNLFVGFFNLVVDILVLIRNLFADVANFFGNIFDDPVAAVCRLFFAFADKVIGIIETIARAIDAVFGGNLAATARGWRDSLGGWVENTYGSGIEVMGKLSANDFHLGRFEYGAAYELGYNFGQGIDNRVSDMFNIGNVFDGLDTGFDFDYDPMPVNNDGIEDTAFNTGAMRDAMEISGENLKYLRDLAERETINRFTTAEFVVNLGGITNNVNSEMDLDGIASYVTNALEESVSEMLNTQAEGINLQI